MRIKTTECTREKNQLRDTPMSTIAKEHTLPDLWTHCPFPPKFHDNSTEVIAESQKWFDNSGTTLFAQSSPYAALRESIDSAGVGQLVACCFPDVTQEKFRILCDLGFILFLLDDLGDVMVQAEWERVKNAIENVLNDGKIIEQGVEGDVAKLFDDWWKRIKGSLSPAYQGRYVQDFTEYLEGIRLETDHRDSGHIHPTHEEYITHRRWNSGAKPFLELIEYSVNVELAEEVRSHPQYVKMEDAVSDYVSLTNDIFSYKKEQKDEHNHNMVIILCKTQDKDLQRAINHVGELSTKAIDTYLEAKAKLPFQGEDIAACCGALENVISGSLEWSVSISRYFGTEGGKIKEEKKIVL